MYRRILKSVILLGAVAMLSGCAVVEDINADETTVTMTNTAEYEETDSTAMAVVQASEAVVNGSGEVEKDEETSEAKVIVDYEKTAFLSYLEANSIVYGRGMYAEEIIVTSEQDEEGNWHEYLYRLNEDSCQWERFNELAICAEVSDVHRKYCDGIKEIIVCVSRDEDIAIIVDYDTLGKFFVTTDDYGQTLNLHTLPEVVQDIYSSIKSFYYNDGVMLLGSAGFDYSNGGCVYISYDKGDNWEKVELDLGDILVDSAIPKSFVEYNGSLLCLMQVGIYELSDSEVYVKVPMKDNEVELSYITIQSEDAGKNERSWNGEDFSMRYHVEGVTTKLDISWRGYSCQLENNDLITGSISILENPVDFDGDGELETLFYYQSGARGSMNPYVLDIYNGELRCYEYQVPEIEYQVLNDYRIWYTSEGMEYPGIIDFREHEYYVESWWDENGCVIEGKQYDVWPYTTYDIEYYQENDGSYIIAIGTDMCVESGAGAYKTLFSYFKIADGELKLIERK